MLISAPNATVVGFVIEPDDEEIPKVWVCLQPECDVIVRMEGARIIQLGYVTCSRCSRPMHLSLETVH